MSLISSAFNQCWRDGSEFQKRLPTKTLLTLHLTSFCFLGASRDCQEQEDSGEDHLIDRLRPRYTVYKGQSIREGEREERLGFLSYTYSSLHGWSVS